MGSQIFVVAKGLDHDQLAIVWMASKLAVKKINFWILQDELPPEEHSDTAADADHQDESYIRLYRPDSTTA